MGAVPPAAVTGVTGVSDLFWVALTEATESVTTTGPGKTPKTKVAVAVAPAASVAVTVYVPESVADVGVPAISPVTGLSTRPAGRGGETE
jgi:hypothetical protein